MVEELPIKGFDHVELYVGNAKQAAHFYGNAFGFKTVGYAGPETGVRDRSSYVLQQGNLTLVVTGTQTDTSYIAEHVRVHGDGVKNIAFLVDDAEEVHKEAIKRGAKDFTSSYFICDENNKPQEEVFVPGILTYGDTVHTFIDRKDDDVFLPGYERRTAHDNIEGSGLLRIDHVVGNVPVGEMKNLDDYYENIFGFEKIFEVDENDISTQYSALKSVVRANSSRTVRLPINEPAKGKKISQIQEYLDFYKGPGVQHIALETDDILKAVKTLRNNCIEFLDIPDTYYDNVSDRVGEVEGILDEISKLHILADKDEFGYMLQIFTKPLQDRPTLFFEIIQREGAQSFGHNNFQALFEAIEGEQDNRGNL